MTTIGDVLVLAGWAALGYYLGITGLYVLVHVAAAFELRRDVNRPRKNPLYQPFSSPFLPGVAVVVPAYNEAAVIEDCVQSLLNLNYPETELVVVNDGSEDDTLDRLRAAYDLEPVDAPVPYEVPCEPIRAVYRSAEVSNLVVIDKENGGKGDALNAGIWLTEMPLFCAVDSDAVIDRDGLLQVVEPFLERPAETVATGGTVRVINGCRVAGGGIQRAGLPDSTLAELQTIEYLRAFYFGRMGLDRLDSLLLISGAFGVFRTDVVRDVGGYATDSITEDFELTVRLHRHLQETNRSYHIEFVPEPVVWTEVPESRGGFSRQRRRWYRGLLDTMARHRGMMGRPSYGAPGLFGVPAFLVAEVSGRLVEGAGYVLVLVAFAIGAADLSFVAVYFLLTVGAGVFLSWFGVLSEVWTYRRYDRPAQVVRLLGDGVVENFGFRQWKTLLAWRALFEYLRGDSSWGEMRRRGFDDEG